MGYETLCADREVWREKITEIGTHSLYPLFVPELKHHLLKERASNSHNLDSHTRYFVTDTTGGKYIPRTIDSLSDNNNTSLSPDISYEQNTLTSNKSGHCLIREVICLALDSDSRLTQTEVWIVPKH